MFLKGSDKQLSRFASGIKRKQLRILGGLLSGHIALNRHLGVMKIGTDPQCPACGEGEDTSYHLLVKCCGYKVSRYSIIAAHTIEPEELGKAEQPLFFGSQEPLTGFYDLWLYWGCALD